MSGVRCGGEKFFEVLGGGAINALECEEGDFVFDVTRNGKPV